MDTLITNLISILVGGGPQAVLAVLVLVIVLLLIERKSLKSEIAKQNEKMDGMIDQYYRGNLTLSEALNSLKMVLFELKSKI